MVGREGEVFSNRMLHYATSLHGTWQYRFKQRSRLIAIVDTIGLPTIFFTNSAADLQWPELARLIYSDDPDSSSSRSKALQENPAIADVNPSSNPEVRYLRLNRRTRDTNLLRLAPPMMSETDGRLRYSLLRAPG